MDGAGWFSIYRRIVMPLSGPAIATVAILTFLPAWNSYLWPLMVVQSEDLRPVMVGTAVLLPAQRLVGADHGLPDSDHHPGARALHRLPAVIHHSIASAVFGGQGLSPRPQIGPDVPLHAAPQLAERSERAGLLQRRLAPVLPAQPEWRGLGQHVLGPRGQPRPGRLGRATCRHLVSAERARVLRQRRGRPRDTSGFGEPGNPAMVAIYTGADPSTGRQAQCSRGARTAGVPFPVRTGTR